MAGWLKSPGHRANMLDPKWPIELWDEDTREEEPRLRLRKAMDDGDANE